MMKSPIVKLFSIVTIILTIGLAPILSCTCQGEEIRGSHSCCPKKLDTEEKTRQAKNKQPCCTIDSAPINSFELNTSEIKIPLFSLIPVPQFSLASLKIPTVELPDPTGWGKGDRDPPPTFLVLHSFLL